MRGRRRVVAWSLALLLVAVATVASAPAASACVCGSPPYPDLRKDYPVGMIGSVDAEAADSVSRTLRVDRWLYGPLTGDTVEVHIGGCGERVLPGVRYAFFLFEDTDAGVWRGGDYCSTKATGHVLSIVDPPVRPPGEARFVTWAAPHEATLATLDADGRLVDQVGPPANGEQLYDPDQALFASAARTRLWPCGAGHAVSGFNDGSGIDLVLWDLGELRARDEVRVMSARDLRCDGDGTGIRVLDALGGVTRPFEDKAAAASAGRLVPEPFVGFGSILTRNGVLTRTDPSTPDPGTWQHVTDEGVVTQLGAPVTEVFRIATNPAGSLIAWVVDSPTEPGRGAGAGPATSTVEIVDPVAGTRLARRTFAGSTTSLDWVDDDHLYVAAEGRNLLVDPATLADRLVLDDRRLGSRTWAGDVLWMTHFGSVGAVPLDGGPIRYGHHFSSNHLSRVLLLPEPLPAPATTVTIQGATTLATTAATGAGIAGDDSRRPAPWPAVAAVGSVAALAAGVAVVVRRRR